LNVRHLSELAASWPSRRASASSKMRSAILMCSPMPNSKKVMEMIRAQRHPPELDPGEQARELAEQLYVETGKRVKLARPAEG
jgi:hypothetical protein